MEGTMEGTKAAGQSMSSGEALAEILRLVRQIAEGVEALIGFVNEAGEQLNAVAAQGIGELLGSFVGNGQSGGD